MVYPKKSVRRAFMSDRQMQKKQAERSISACRIHFPQFGSEINPNSGSRLPRFRKRHCGIDIFQPAFVTPFHCRQVEEHSLLRLILTDPRQLGVHLHGL